MNGITATAHLADTLDAPVLLVSGLDYESTRQLAKEVGAVDLLAKPFSEQQLEAALGRALRPA
jgi:CheY-like chemotaxis protein